MWIFILGTLVLLAFVFCVYITWDMLRMSKKRREKASSEQTSKEADKERRRFERIKQAKMWNESLGTFGIHHSIETLMSMDDGRILEENQIPLQSVFTQDEYSKLVSILLPEYVKRFDKDGYYKSVHLDELSVAVHAKELTVYVQKLEEALDVLVKKESWQTLSDKELEKKEELEAEIEQCKAEIKGYSEFQLDLNRTITEKGVVSGYVIFNPFASFDEKKVLDLITSIIGSGKPEMKEPVLKGTYVTSPALEELNTFLNEKTLPDEKVQELRETMREIQHKLREELERDEEEDTLLLADVLNKTSRQFHQLESTT